MTVSKARSATSATSYYIHMKEEGSRNPEDYYSKEGDAGHWVGGARQALRLGDDVIGDQFLKLAMGFDPRTGEALVHKAGEPDRRAGWDATFSAPKSVSIEWAMADHKTRVAIEAAHTSAANKAFAFLEEKAAWARVGAHGTGQENALERVKLLAASFQHGTSREGDPQLHSHFFIFNQGLRDDGRWAGLESREIMLWAKAAGAAYRAELASEMKALGYQVVRDEESFRLEHISKELCEEFSQARNRIVREMAERGVSGAAAAEIVNLETRKAKDPSIDKALQREAWQAAAVRGGYLSKEQYIEKSIAESLETPAKEAVKLTGQSVLEKATEFKAVIREQDIYMTAFQEVQGVGAVGYGRVLAESSIDKALQIVSTDPAAGKEDVRFTTQELYEKERLIVSHAERMAAETRFNVGAETVASAISKFENEKNQELSSQGKKEGFQLNAEQKKAVNYICNESGGIAVMIGDAGTGKTTVMTAVKEAYQSAGYEVTGSILNNSF